MKQSTEADIKLRRRITEAIESAWAPEDGFAVENAADAAMNVVSPELERLRYERHLLGAARRVLDLVAAGDPSRWEQARQEAEDVAQRIVDEIGHPVTDEPALGPSYRAAIERVRTLHYPMTHGGITICGHCSGWNGFRCGGVVQPMPCPTLADLGG